MISIVMSVIKLSLKSEKSPASTNSVTVTAEMYLSEECQTGNSEKNEPESRREVPKFSTHSSGTTQSTAASTGAVAARLQSWLVEQTPFCLSNMSITLEHDRMEDISLSPLERVLRDSEECDRFRIFLQENHAEEDAMFWADVDAFRNADFHNEDDRNAEAKRIFSSFLQEKGRYFLKEIPAEVRQEINERLNTVHAPNAQMFDVAQEIITNVLAGYLPRFLDNEAHKTRM